MASAGPVREAGGENPQQAACGYVFYCSDGTFQEAMDLRIFANLSDKFELMQQHIRQGATTLFLFNYWAANRLLLGPFEVIEGPARDIVPGAFGGDFPAQVRVLPAEPLHQVHVERQTKITPGPKSASEVEALKAMLRGPQFDAKGGTTGYVFYCGDSTYQETMQRQLFADQAEKLHQMQRHIRPGTSLFLFNHWTATQSLLGPFEVVEGPALDMELGAFEGNFPAQVRVKPAEPLHELHNEWQIAPGPKSATEVVALMTMLYGAEVDPQVDTPGYLFYASDHTFQEAMDGLLFADSADKLEQMQQHIKPGTSIFLFNYWTRRQLLLGPFRVVEGPALDLLPTAFEGHYPAQVRVQPEEPMHQLHTKWQIAMGPKSPSELAALMTLLRGPEVDKQDSATGYVFYSSDETHDEALDKHLLADSEEKFEQMQKHIKRGTVLFLVNNWTRKRLLVGPFEAIDAPALDIVPDAFLGDFPAQVRVKPGDPQHQIHLDPETDIAPGPRSASDVAALIELLRGDRAGRC